MLIVTGNWTFPVMIVTYEVASTWNGGVRYMAYSTRSHLAYDLLQ